jgi:hypothetical protein
VNNTIWVFEEAFIRLKWYSAYTPLVKLNKKIGEPHACAHSPRRAEAMGMAWAVRNGLKYSQQWK